MYFFVLFKKDSLRLVLFACLLVVPALRAQLQFRSVDIYSQEDTAEPAVAEHCIYRPHHDVRLGIVLKTQPAADKDSRYYSTFEQIIINADTLRTTGEFLPDESVVRWYVIRPKRLDTLYYNYYHNLLPWARVQYRETLIPEWNDRWQVALHSLSRYDKYFPGTIWLKVAFAHSKQYLTSPSMESRFYVPQGDYGGLTNKVCRISIAGHCGQPLVDNLLIFRNVPVIANPGSWNNTWSEHQTPNWIGGNMRSFVICAAELAGRSLAPYLNRFTLPQLNDFTITDYYARQVFLVEGQYLINWESPVALSAAVYTVGDLILKDRQLSVFYQDNSPLVSAQKGYPNGLLDTTDQVITIRDGILDIYTLGESLGDSLTLIRWKERWPAAE